MPLVGRIAQVLDDGVLVSPENDYSLVFVRLASTQGLVDDMDVAEWGLPGRDSLHVRPALARPVRVYEFVDDLR